MTAKEQRISDTIARLLPTLSEGQKDCFLAYAEGMAAALDTRPEGQKDCFLAYAEGMAAALDTIKPRAT